MAMKTEGEDNSFFRLLTAAEEFRKAELTPVYILDATTMDVMVVAKETHNKRLH